MIDRAFQLRAEVRQPAVEIVVGNQAENRDGQAAGGGDQRLGDAAAHFRRGELLVSDKVERAHNAGDGAQQAKQRREGDERAEHPLQAFAALQFIRCAKLHGAQQRTVRVEQSFMDSAEKRIVGVIREFQRIFKFAGGDCVEAVL